MPVSVLLRCDDRCSVESTVAAGASTLLPPKHCCKLLTKLAE